LIATGTVESADELLGVDGNLHGAFLTIKIVNDALHADYKLFAEATELAGKKAEEIIPNYVEEPQTGSPRFGWRTGFWGLS